MKGSTQINVALFDWIDAFLPQPYEYGMAPPFYSIKLRDGFRLYLTGVKYFNNEYNRR